jgi:hypothetical protein
MKTFFLLNTLTGQAVEVYFADRDLAEKARAIVARNDAKLGRPQPHGWTVQETCVQFAKQEAVA